MNRKKQSRGLYLAVAVAALGVVSLWTIRADAIAPVLPKSTLITPGTTQAGGVANGMDLHLKDQTVAKVIKNKFSAYFPATDTSSTGKALKITRGVNNDDRCDIDASVKRRSNTGVQVKITTNVGAKTYQIPISKICGSSSEFYNKIFAFAPGQQLIKDDSGYSKATIEVGYYGDSNAKDLYNNLNYDAVLLHASTKLPYDTAKLALAGSTSSDQFGIRSHYGSSYSGIRKNRTTLARVMFGYPCTADNIDYKKRRVLLYDPDVGFGTTYMKILKNGTALAKNEYVSATTLQASLFDARKTWDATRRAWSVPLGDKITDVLQMNETVIERGATYELWVEVTGKAPGGGNSNLNPHDNTLSLSIPYDSVYGSVSCDYNLQPKAEVKDFYAPGERLDVTGSVQNTGMSDVKDSHDWHTYAVKYTSNPTRDLGGDTAAADPCNVIPVDNLIVGSCRKIISKSYPDTDKVITAYPTDPGDPYGTYVCFFTRVGNPTESASDDTKYRYSDLDCAIAGIQPKVQVLGGDLQVMGNVDTSTTQIDDKLYGSWAEYAALVNGDVNNFSTGGGLRGGNTNSSQAAWSDLTFANLDNMGEPYYGNYQGVTPAVVAPEGTLRSSIDYGGYGPGERVVVKVSGTLRITGDVKYTGSYSSVGQIPRVILMADDIVIDPGVKQIDAWLVAASTDPEKGRISTCSTVQSPPGDYFVDMTEDNLLSTNDCKNSLVFNGPVVANKIYLYRTHHWTDIAHADVAAETFNLRGDAYLSAFSGTSARSVVTTDMVTELPPRF